MFTDFVNNFLKKIFFVFVNVVEFHVLIKKKEEEESQVLKNISKIKYNHMKEKFLLLEC